MASLTWVDGKDGGATLAVGADYHLSLSQKGKLFTAKFLDMPTQSILFEHIRITAETMEDAKREAMFLASNALSDLVKRAMRAEKKLVDSAIS